MVALQQKSTGRQHDGCPDDHDDKDDEVGENDQDAKF